MGVGEAPRIAATLIAAGKPPSLPIAIVINASLPEREVRYTTLRELPLVAAAQVSGPALILLGEQFKSRERIDAASPSFEGAPTHARSA